MVFRGSAAHSGDQFASGWADAEDPAFGEEMLSAPLFQVVPALVGSMQQRDVIGMLVVGFADDARLSVRGAAVVAGDKLFKGQDAPPATGQLERRGRAHRTYPEDDRVETAPAH